MVLAIDADFNRSTIVVHHTQGHGMQIMRAAGSIARRSRFEAWLLAILLIGCTKEESLRPSRAHSSATLMASELGRSKDFFFQVPSAVDGSFTDRKSVV